MSVYGFWMLLATTLFSLCTASAQDWSWLVNPIRNIGIQQAVLSGASDTVIVSAKDNVYIGSGSAPGREVLTAADFVLIEDRPRLYVFPSGPFIAAGSSLDQTRSAGFRFSRRPGGDYGYEKTTFDGAAFSVGFSAGDLSVLGNTTMRLRNAYTFDAGATWYNMTNEPQLGSSGAVSLINGKGVYVYKKEESRWFFVDTASRTYTPTADIATDICHICVLPSGAAMGIRCNVGDETDLVIRRSSSGPWESVPRLAAPNGNFVNPKSQVYLRGSWLTTLSSGRALFVIDSGRAIEFDGDSVRLRLLGDDMIAGKLASVLTVRPRGEDLLRAVYEVRTTSGRTYTTVDISLVTGQTQVRRGKRFQPLDMNEQGYLSGGPYFTDWATGTSRPALRYSPGNRSIRDVQDLLPSLRQVVALGTTPLTVTGEGEVLVLDQFQRLPFLYPGSFSSRTDTKAGSVVLNRVSIHVVDDTSFVYPSLYPTRNSKSGQNFRMPGIDILRSNARLTCGATDGQGRQLLAGSAIIRLNGATWDSIPFPDRFRDSAVTISSIAVYGTDTIIAAGRGYGIGSSTEGTFAERRGGIVMSTNGGRDWSNLNLPQQEQWVESLTKGPDGALYCWATSMIFDTDNGTFASVQPRYGSARVYRSSDKGLTWTELFIDEADDNLRRPAVDHQWSISFSPSSVIAISTPTAIYVAPGVGDPFVKVLSLPANASFGGCALDADGYLWVAGSHGLHRRESITSSINAGQAPRAGVTVSPNPTLDRCIIMISSGESLQRLPEHVTITSVDGSVVQHVPGVDGEYSTATTHLPAGAYVVHAVVGTDVVSTLFTVVR